MYIHVHNCIHMYIHSTGTSVLLQNHNSLLIRPDQPCDACKSQLRAGAAPSEQPPSLHQSFQQTDHPGVACHAQTATATGSPHTHQGWSSGPPSGPVIRAASVGCILWGSPTCWTQVAGKEKLWTSIPTVFQRNIVVVLLNAVRIRRDNKYGVLHTIKLVVQLESSTYILEHCIYHVYTSYIKAGTCI